METHYTPQHLILKIKKHLPRKFLTVLEPSVGDGALLQALPRTSKKLIISAFDISPTVADKFKEERFLNGNVVDFKCCCFLEWFHSASEKSIYDLVLMNPPFSGRSETWVQHEGKKVPLEIAFLRASISLCRDGGTIIAILPKSVVAGELKCSVEIREHMFSSLNISHCYELTEFEFPSIEGQFYLLVAKKLKRSSSVSLRNMNGGEFRPAKKLLQRNMYRLDYAYYESLTLLNKIMSSSSFNATSLESVANLYRGPLKPPYDKQAVIHSSSYNGCWGVNTSTVFNEKIFSNYVCGGDILVKRVGRNCLDSFGLMRLNRKQVATDCILIIRAKSPDMRIPILLSLRVLYSSDLGKSYLQKGTGAKYLTASLLYSSPIILNLLNIYPGYTIPYSEAVDRGEINKMVTIESEIRNKIFAESDSIVSPNWNSGDSLPISISG